MGKTKASTGLELCQHIFYTGFFGKIWHSARIFGISWWYKNEREAKVVNYKSMASSLPSSILVRASITVTLKYRGWTLHCSPPPHPVCWDIVWKFYH